VNRLFVAAVSTKAQGVVTVAAYRDPRRGEGSAEVVRQRFDAGEAHRGVLGLAFSA
jgi:hypothetical protein